VAAELIGRCKCPLCGGVARLSLAKTQLSVLTCNGCNFQGFARSDRSDEKLRALLIPEPAAAQALAETKQALVSAGRAAPEPEPGPTPTPAPAPAKPNWGLFGG
jgi:hypothetical protein